MQRSQLRERLREFPARLEQNLPANRKFYILIALAFGCVGYLAGVALLGRFTPAPINLEEPVLPPVEGGRKPGAAGHPLRRSQRIQASNRSPRYRASTLGRAGPIRLHRS